METNFAIGWFNCTVREITKTVLVQLASEVHNYNTRYATNQNLYRPPSRSNYGLARFRVVASQIWEAIPIDIKCLPFSTFKKEY